MMLAAPFEVQVNAIDFCLLAHVLDLIQYIDQKLILGLLFSYCDFERGNQSIFDFIK